MTWNFLDGANQSFSFEPSQVAELLENGTLTPETPVWNSSMVEWTPAGQVWEQLTGAPLPSPVSLPPSMPVPPPLPRAGSSPGPAPRGPAASRSTRARKPARKRGIGFYAVLLVSGLFLVMVINGVRALKHYKPIPKTPAQEGLAVAETCISSKSGNSAGSNPEETKAAQVMAEMSALYRDMTISAGSSRAKGLFRKAAKGMDAKDFVAYCKVKDDAALFLLHVPDLRKFEEAAKKGMLQGAWMSAQFAIASMPGPKPKRLTVGIRGILSYFETHSGKVVDSSIFENSGEREPSPAQMGIEKTIKDPEEMKAAFLTFFETAGPAVPAAAKSP